MFRRLSLTTVLVLLTTSTIFGSVTNVRRPESAEPREYHILKAEPAKTPVSPKIPILDEPMISHDRTRVYFPYLPYNYGYSYGFGQRVYVPFDYQRQQPPIVLFNEELDMALIWDEQWQHLKWEPIVPPRVNNSHPAILVNQVPQEVEKNKDEKTLKLQAKVTAIAKGTVLLESGETFKITPETQILLLDKKPGKVEDIKTGILVRAHLDATGSAIFVEIIETP